LAIAKNKKYWTRSEYKQKYRKYRLRRDYGLTEEDYNLIAEQQGNVCAICKQLDPHTKLVVDHDHKTGEVRGLLCNKCNRALGVFNDDLSVLRLCFAYLTKFSKRRSWDDYFLDIAELVLTRSKDPSSKVGAVIVRDRTILSTGYNGFPRGVDDDVPTRYNRPEKYLWTIHAEENAILNAGRLGAKTKDSTIYVTPMSPCSNCALSIVQAGIKEVVFRKSIENPRFEESFQKAFEILSICKIIVRRIGG